MTIHSVLEMREVEKRRLGVVSFVLRVNEFLVGKGEKVALVGNSGCGKSTLLDLLALVSRPDAASTFCLHDERDGVLDIAATWQSQDRNRLAALRRHHLGYVLQTGGLFSFLSVRENMSMHLPAAGVDGPGDVEKLAHRLGIHRHLDKKPGQLSVGERQRVAIARALVHRPALVLADEPTASLDPVNAVEVMSLFADLVAEFGVTLIMATHDHGLAARFSFRTLTFELARAGPQGIVATLVEKAAPRRDEDEGSVPARTLEVEDPGCPVDTPQVGVSSPGERTEGVESAPVAEEQGHEGAVSAPSYPVPASGEEAVKGGGDHGT